MKITFFIAFIAISATMLVISTMSQQYQTKKMRRVLDTVKSNASAQATIDLQTAIDASVTADLALNVSKASSAVANATLQAAQALSVVANTTALIADAASFQANLTLAQALQGGALLSASAVAANYSLFQAQVADSVPTQIKSNDAQQAIFKSSLATHNAATFLVLAATNATLQATASLKTLNADPNNSTLIASNYAAQNASIYANAESALAAVASTAVEAAVTKAQTSVETVNQGNADAVVSTCTLAASTSLSASQYYNANVSNSLSAQVLIAANQASILDAAAIAARAAVQQAVNSASLATAAVIAASVASAQAKYTVTQAFIAQQAAIASDAALNKSLTAAVQVNFTNSAQTNQTAKAAKDAAQAAKDALQASANASAIASKEASTTAKAGAQLANANSKAAAGLVVLANVTLQAANAVSLQANQSLAALVAAGALLDASVIAANYSLVQAQVADSVPTQLKSNAAQQAIFLSKLAASAAATSNRLKATAALNVLLLAQQASALDPFNLTLQAAISVALNASTIANAQASLTDIAVTAASAAITKAQTSVETVNQGNADAVVTTSVLAASTALQAAQYSDSLIAAAANISAIASAQAAVANSQYQLAVAVRVAADALALTAQKGADDSAAKAACSDAQLRTILAIKLKTLGCVKPPVGSSEKVFRQQRILCGSLSFRSRLSLKYQRSACPNSNVTSSSS